VLPVVEAEDVEVVGPDGEPVGAASEGATEGASEGATEQATPAPGSTDTSAEEATS
jgi:hypothetical protein